MESATDIRKTLDAAASPRASPPPSRKPPPTPKTDERAMRVAARLAAKDRN